MSNVKKVPGGVEISASVLAPEAAVQLIQELVAEAYELLPEATDRLVRSLFRESERRRMRERTQVRQSRRVRIVGTRHWYVCESCGKEKPEEEFRTYGKGVSYDCYECADRKRYKQRDEDEAARAAVERKFREDQARWDKEAAERAKNLRSNGNEKSGVGSAETP